MTLEDTENKRKRLIFRSWHRGTREMDLIMGTFADQNLAGFDENALEQYEHILQMPDPDIYNWVSGREAAPANTITPVMQKLLDHHVASKLLNKN